MTVSKTNELLIDWEIIEVLDNGTIKKLKYHIPGKFLRNILLVKKKDWGNRSCINLKALGGLILYEYFKMEGLHCFKYFLEENDFLRQKFR